MLRKRKKAIGFKLDPVTIEIGEKLRQSTRHNRAVGYRILEELKEIMRQELSPVGADERLYVLQALFQDFAATLQERSALFMELTVRQDRLPYHN